MARATLEARLELDTTKFQKNLTKAKAVMAKFKVAMGKLGGGLASVGKNVAKLTAGFVALGVAVGAGVKKALDFGGKVSDISARTGLSAKEVTIWGEALRQAGYDGDELWNSVAKLNKNISEAVFNDASLQAGVLGELGLDAERLDKLDTGTRLKEVFDGLKNIDDITTRSRISEMLLGRSGSKLFGLLSDTKALQKAVQTLGQGQVDIISKQAEKMDLISDRIGGIGVKVRGFFVGVADKLIPLLTSATEAMNSVDLSEAGQKFGTAINNILKNFGTSMGSVIEAVFDVVAVNLENAVNPFWDEETKQKRREQAKANVAAAVRHLTGTEVDLTKAGENGGAVGRLPAREALRRHAEAQQAANINPNPRNIFEVGKPAPAAEPTSLDKALLEIFANRITQSNREVLTIE